MKIFDAAQQKKAAELDLKVEISEEQPAFQKTASKTSKTRKREENGSDRESSSGRSGREVRKPEVNKI